MSNFQLAFNKVGTETTRPHRTVHKPVFQLAFNKVGTETFIRSLVFLGSESFQLAFNKVGTETL